ncbi:hypothetical protein M9978_11575 [Sphingomonas sp. MG17]|uniref:Uncharacterized protein n=1 Tax=Sphingomonas tagetis TaxID=2949092 RepID=A0A9X2KLX3_9SPHN|nr:hypothetical protein [Sphingomonas tagetis]MCP3731067.1 hypothetical protein [Sphingomonas tagetis]
MPPVVKQALVGGAAGAAGGLAVAIALNATGTGLLVNSGVVGAAIGASLTILGTLAVDRYIRARAGRERHRAALDLFEGIRDSLAGISGAKGADAKRLLEQAKLGKRVLDLEKNGIALGLLGRAALLKLEDAWSGNIGTIEGQMGVAVMYPEYSMPDTVRAAVGALTAHLDLVIASVPSGS